MEDNAKFVERPLSVVMPSINHSISEKDDPFDINLKEYIQHLFVEHPNKVGQTYWQHFQDASWKGLKAIGAGCIMIIHGILPCTFTTTGGDIITDIHIDIVNKRKKKE